MIVYRITHQQYADSLTASGVCGRWNDPGQFVIYTSENRSLACLENLVHRSGRGLHGLYRIMEISVPDDAPNTHILPTQLHDRWRNAQENHCRNIGSPWYKANKELYLKVPSALVPQEFNLMVNTRHPLFSKVTLLQTEAFLFDERVA
jgi:RES domain-containing protein